MLIKKRYHTASISEEQNILSLEDTIAIHSLMSKPQTDFVSVLEQHFCQGRRSLKLLKWLENIDFTSSEQKAP